MRWQKMSIKLVPALLLGWLASTGTWADVDTGKSVIAASAKIEEERELTGQFRHGPLLRDARGQKLSKREASSGLEPLRTAGLDAAAVIGRLASGLQLLEPGESLSATELLEHLTQQKINAVIS